MPLTLAFILLLGSQAVRAGDTATPATDHTMANVPACLKTGNEADARRMQAMQLMLDRDTHRSIDGYHRAIRTLKSRYGPLDERLVPDLLNLGLLYSKSRAYGEATGAFQQALHISRVNKGLYDLNQVPIIDLLIRSSTAGGQWARVDQAYDLMYWVYRRNYKPDDPRLLPVLKRFYRWHLEAYNKKTGRSLEDHFRLATAARSQAARIIDQCRGTNVSAR